MPWATIFTATSRGPGDDAVMAVPSHPPSVASGSLALPASAARWVPADGVRPRVSAWFQLRLRVALAAGLERAAWAPTGRSGPTCAVPADADAVRLARPDLLALARTLRSEDPVTSAGLRMVDGLVCDGGSSLYCPRRPGELREAALAARSALDGRVTA